MKKLWTSSVFLLVLASCNNNSSSETDKKGNSDTSKQKTETTMSSADNILSDQEKADGWQLLFDGQTTKGWHKYGSALAGTAWKVADGILYLDTLSKKEQASSGGDIVTNDEYENFDLKLDWKISPAGNSGIMFRVHEDTTRFHATYESGPEMQIVDNDGHPDGKIIKHQAGDLYDLIACSKKTVKPVGEWNQAEIKSVNGKLDLYLNGENVVSTAIGDDNWKKLVAGSKFKAWPGFATYPKGRICLQDHGDKVSFRNIKVKRL